MPLSVCSDSEEDPDRISSRTLIDSTIWNNIANIEGVSFPHT